MSEPEQSRAANKPVEEEGPSEQQFESPVDEATRSAAELIKQQRKQLKVQKDPNRPPSDTSLKFGRPEIVGDEGETLVKPTLSAEIAAVHSPLEEPGKVKERIRGNTNPGHPFDEVHYEDGTKRQIRPGGTIVEVRKNMTIMLRPDFSLAITQQGKTREVKPSHSERGIMTVKVDDSGDVVYQYKDGSSEVRYKPERSP